MGLLAALAGARSQSKHPASQQIKLQVGSSVLIKLGDGWMDSPITPFDQFRLQDLYGR